MAPVLISAHVERAPSDSSGFLRSVRRLRQRGQLTDVQLMAADGEPLRAHAAMLHMCSSLFSDTMADGGGHEDAVIVLPDFSRDTVAAMIQFIYTGECYVSGSKMEELHQLLSIVIDRWKMQLTASAGPGAVTAQEPFVIDLSDEEDGRFLDDSVPQQDGGELPLAEQQDAEESSDEEEELSERPTTSGTALFDRKCPVCFKNQKTLWVMRIHVARHHFINQIREQSGIGTSGRRCPECDTTLSSNLSLVNHLAYVHRVISQVVKDQEMLRRIHCSSKPGRKRKAAFVAPIEAKVARPDPPGECLCPVCHVTLGDRSSFRKHFIEHYKDKIRRKYGISDARPKCPLCEFTHEDPDAVAVHAGVTHAEVRMAIGGRELFRQVFENIE